MLLPDNNACITMPDNPFDAAVDAAKTLTSQLARTTLLSEIAKIQFDAGLVDEPLRIAALIESPLEKRNVLRNAALDFIERKTNFDALPKILKMFLDAETQTHSRNSYFAGQVAILLLEVKPPQIETALQVLKTTDEPFESDSIRYDFITKLLKTGGKNYKDTVKKMLPLFKSSDYRDWGCLMLLKAFADWSEWSEAEKTADSFVPHLRKSWAFFELSKIARKEENKQRAADYFSLAADILSTAADNVSREQKEVHRTAVQLRIFGKEALKYGSENSGEDSNKDKGTKLLEQAEEVAAGIIPPLERCRQQLFIAKVLQEFRELDLVQNYVNIKIIDDKTLSGIDRSRIIQWFLEVKQHSNNTGGGYKFPDWSQAVQTAAEEVPKTPFAAADELNQVKRIAEILRRFVHRKQMVAANGNPKDDINRLSGEEYEEYYYSPFAVEDCGC
ncbi:hypothetical protein FACS18942_02290 [Planctomycetales bacterium]|nr:hypothetical protein FACS18942_02290 [Planctomycetales bacterium]GHT35641.1 hypothetical protein FACS189427_05380 [Planctomycetales bacterium]